MIPMIVRISLYHSWSSQNKREWHGLRIAGRIRVARGSRHANGIASCRSIRVGVLFRFLSPGQEGRRKLRSWMPGSSRKQKNNRENQRAAAIWKIRIWPCCELTAKPILPLRERKTRCTMMHRLALGCWRRTDIPKTVPYCHWRLCRKWTPIISFSSMMLTLQRPQSRKKSLPPCGNHWNQSKTIMFFFSILLWIRDASWRSGWPQRMELAGR